LRGIELAALRGFQGSADLRAFRIEVLRLHREWQGQAGGDSEYDGEVGSCHGANIRDGG
jgi:hypothetical protein